MTCFDMYVSEHSLPLVGCPHDYGYIPEKPAECYQMSCYKDCWAREIPDKKKGDKKE